MATDRRYATYARQPAWRRLATRLRHKITPVDPDAWRGDPDKIRLVHEDRGWVLRWTEPSREADQHYGFDRLDELLDWARSREPHRIVAVSLRIDPDRTARTGNVVRRDQPPARPWVEVVCPEPGPLLATAREFFGPGDWVDQAGEARIFVTR